MFVHFYLSKRNRIYLFVGLNPIVFTETKRRKKWNTLKCCYPTIWPFKFTLQSPPPFSLFLGLHLRHMEVPRLRLNWSCSCQLTPQLQQRGIWAASVTYTTAHSTARSLTHWARPGIEPVSSWILVGFVNHWAMMETPSLPFWWEFDIFNQQNNKLSSHIFDLLDTT